MINGAQASIYPGLWPACCLHLMGDFIESSSSFHQDPGSTGQLAVGTTRHQWALGSTDQCNVSPVPVLTRHQDIHYIQSGDREVTRHQ